MRSPFMCVVSLFLRLSPRCVLVRIQMCSVFFRGVTLYCLHVPLRGSWANLLLSFLIKTNVRQHSHRAVQRAVPPPPPRSTAGPVSYAWVARSRSESTSQFTALALNKPSSSSYSSASSSSLCVFSQKSHSLPKSPCHSQPPASRCVSLAASRGARAA